ncbi:MAG: hypothetical protein AAGH76_08780 [Pseudomonadota bacterium]
MLLDLFFDVVPDRESNRRVWDFCENPHQWIKAKDLMSEIRNKTLLAPKKGESIAKAQYLFEEAIAKTLYNSTKPIAPFDSDSEAWIEVNAMSLAKLLGLPQERVSDVIA